MPATQLLCQFVNFCLDSGNPVLIPKQIGSWGPLKQQERHSPPPPSLRLSFPPQMLCGAVSVSCKFCERISSDGPVLKGSVDWCGKMPGSGPSGKELVDALAPCWSMDTSHSGRNVPDICLGPKKERSKKKKIEEKAHQKKKKI